jgi:uncharacterized membrane protein
MDGASDIFLFFGRFHPMILHLPIGFLVIGFVLEILSRYRKFTKFKPAVGFILLLGAASSMLTAVLGYMLAEAGGYNKNLLSIHQWSGIAVVVFSVAALILHWQSQTRSSVVVAKAYLSVMCLMVVALMVAGHFGGSLTHGSGFLTLYMPNSLRTLAGLPAKEKKERKKIINLNEAVVFTDIIYPILDARCTSCHNESKSKGDLQMHTIEALMKGGENGPIFITGNAEGSEMIKRLHLPENDENHMPPKGKSQLTDEQIKLLTWWIAEGASFDKTVSELKVNNEVQIVLNTLVDPDANKTEVEKLLASQISPVDEQILKQLQDKGLRIRSIGGEVHWLQLTVTQNQRGDSLMDHLSKVSQQLTWLDLGETSTRDKDLSSVSKFKNLTRLHLENTQVTDEGLQYLKGLTYLEYLNLYGTKVSDKGIKHLAGLKNLKKLYLWKTEVTKEGAAELQRSLPGVEVNHGKWVWNTAKKNI